MELQPNPIEPSGQAGNDGQQEQEQQQQQQQQEPPQKPSHNHQHEHPAHSSSVPLSFPAILINPRLKHLHPSRSSNHQSNHQPHHLIRPVGKRRQQRLDNARFTSNPHVAKPTQRDFQLWKSDPTIRFTTPTPKGYPRSLYIPPVEPIPKDVYSSRMGAFNRSLKGVRKSIRRSIGSCDPNHQTMDDKSHKIDSRLEEILIKIDQRLSNWLDTKKVWKSIQPDHTHFIIDSNPWPDSNDRNLIEDDQRPSIVEISRSPYTLNWHVPNRFVRFLVHCVARYYGIVSFSKKNLNSSNSNPIIRSITTDNDAEDPSNSNTSNNLNPTTDTTIPSSEIVCMLKAHLPTRRGSRIHDDHQSLDTPPLTDLDSESSSNLDNLSEGSIGAITDDDYERLSSDGELNLHQPSFTRSINLSSTSTDHHHPSKSTKYSNQENNAISRSNKSKSNPDDVKEGEWEKKELLGCSANEIMINEEITNTPQKNPSLSSQTTSNHEKPINSSSSCLLPPSTSSNFSLKSNPHLQFLSSSSHDPSKMHQKLSFIDWIRLS